MKRLPVLLAVLLAGCAPVRTQTVSIFALPAPPPAMHSMVKVLCNGQWRGWATPYGATFALSVGHVIDGCTTIGWMTPMKHGDFIVLKSAFSETTEHVPIKDYALLLSNVPFDSWVEVSKRKPKPGEVLWHRLLLFGSVPVDAPSFFLGTDADGFYESEGSSRPGSSGSGWFTSSGEVIGVVNGSEGATYGRSVVWGTPTEVIFQ